MEYLLVLQWITSLAKADYEMLVGIESRLMAALSDDNEVDGHDFGSGEMNIFIFTRAPIECFQQVKTLLEKSRNWDSVRIAYRKTSEDQYTILWPEHLTEFRVI